MRPSVRRARAPTPFRRVVKRRSAARAVPRAQTTTQQRVAVRRKSTKRAFRGWFHTRGFMKPNFRKGRRVTTSSFLKSGVGMHVEFGSVSADSDCVWLGHSFAMQQILYITCCALVKKLFSKAGYQVANMYAKIQDQSATWVVSPGTVAYTYSYSAHGSPNNTPLTIAADATFDAVAVQFRNSIMATLAAAGGNHENLFLMELSLTFSGTSNGSRDAVVNLANSVMKYNCDSKMVLQNRTVAQSGAGDETSALDVANNPISGKSYEGKGNGAVPNYRGETSLVAGNSFIGDSNSGYIEFNVNGTSVDASTKATFRRPCNAQAFTNVSRSKGVLLAPGAIKTSVIKYVNTIGLNMMIAKLKDWGERNFTPGFDKITPIGYFRMFAFEKKCNTRVDEPSISVGVELNCMYRAMCWEKPVSTSLMQVDGGYIVPQT